MTELLQHKHLILRALVEKPFNDVEAAKQWLVTIIESIGMKVATSPTLIENPIGFYCDTPGNQGLTAIGILETSHIAIHFWDNVSPAVVHFDLYSCSDFDVSQIVEFLAPLGIVELRGKFLDREENLPILECGGEHGRAA